LRPGLTLAALLIASALGGDVNVPAVSAAVPARSARAAFLVPTSRTETGFGPFTEAPGDAPALRTAFGPPNSSRRGRFHSCVLRWHGLGITARVVAYGSTRGPCRNGSFTEARLTKRRWHTASGIHPGSIKAAARRVALRSCRGRCGGHAGYVLGVHRSDCAPGLFPGVVAEVRAHRVTSLIVYSHGCE
jgi:hypothetical protein